MTSAQTQVQPKRDFRQEVTNSIIRMLEEGVAPWQKPWEAAGSPLNPTTRNAYRGGNAIHLMATGIRRGFDDPRWMTYRQAAQNGWQVRQGEKGTQIEFWEAKPASPKARDGAEGADKDPERRRLIHRVYTVFNAKQIEGVPAYTPRQHSTFEIARAGEQILTNSGARIHHDQADRAFYSPSSDSIQLPPKEAFRNAPGYYGTALHELAHWTGHQSRLNRSTLTDSYRFGDTNYAREELRAELASVFLAAERGIPHNPASHAAYVGSWIKALREDKNEIFRAAHDASAAADYLLSLERGKSVTESLEKAPDSVQAVHQQSGLEGEAGRLEGERLDVTGAVDRSRASETEEERDSTQRTTRYDTGSGTVLIHDKQQGNDRRMPVEGGPAHTASVGREELQRSFAAARDVAAKTLGDNARTHTAMTESGTYRGAIIGETDHHVVQRLGPASAVAHMKQLLQPVPGAGENVLVAYSGYRADVRHLRPREKAQGRAR
jgi:antirestriction protein ArdC